MGGFPKGILFPLRELTNYSRLPNAKNKETS